MEVEGEVWSPIQPLDFVSESNEAEVFHPAQGVRSMIVQMKPDHSCTPFGTYYPGPN